MNDDATLGAYLAVHERPPAFTGSDGRAYSVDVFVDPTPDTSGRHGAALLFVRWSVDGARPDGHVETGYVAWGDTVAEAQREARALGLYEVKRLLDAAIGEDARPGAW